MEEGINEGPTLCRIQAPSHWANSREVVCLSHPLFFFFLSLGR